MKLVSGGLGGVLCLEVHPPISEIRLGLGAGRAAHWAEATAEAEAACLGHLPSGPKGIVRAARYTARWAEPAQLGGGSNLLERPWERMTLVLSRTLAATATQTYEPERLAIHRACNLRPRVACSGLANAVDLTRGSLKLSADLVDISLQVHLLRRRLFRSSARAKYGTQKRTQVIFFGGGILAAMAASMFKHSQFHATAQSLRLPSPMPSWSSPQWPSELPRPSQGSAHHSSR